MVDGENVENEEKITTSEESQKEVVSKEETGPVVDEISEDEIPQLEAESDEEVVIDQVIDQLSSPQAVTGRKSVSLLISVLDDEDPNVRKYALLALIAIGEPAISGLVSLIRRGDPKLIPYGAGGLSKIGKPAISALSVLLGENDVKIRKIAVQTLASIRCPESVEVLKSALKDSSPEVQKLAKMAIKKITGK